MTTPILDEHAALNRIRMHLDDSQGRMLIGLMGKPGAGKSTVSQYFLDRLPQSQVALVPMDGYHLSNRVLALLVRSDRKGAPDTFDVPGFVSLLERIRRQLDEAVYFPVFDRSLEESIAAQGVISPEVKVVLVEGNYLLHDQQGWGAVRHWLDECWMLDVDDELRRSRLIARHVAFGKTEEQARAWVMGSDERNAQTIAQGRARADFWLVPSDLSGPD